MSATDLAEAETSMARLLRPCFGSFITVMVL